MAEVPANSAKFTGVKPIREWIDLLNELLAFYGPAVHLKLADTFDVEIQGRVAVNVTPPTIAGDAEVGATLTLTSVGAWRPAGQSYTYQWMSGTTEIEDATDDTYEVVADDEGEDITCVVTAITEHGSTSETS